MTARPHDKRQLGVVPHSLVESPAVVVERDLAQRDSGLLGFLDVPSVRARMCNAVDLPTLCGQPLNRSGNGWIDLH
jgi:hypothetical protein